MQRTKIQQNELDTCERRILISLFGNETIPELAATGLRILQINPNEIINKFEKLIIPMMTDEGKIDSKICKRILRCSKFGDILEFISLPDDNFYLSDVIVKILGNIIPGLIA